MDFVCRKIWSFALIQLALTPEPSSFNSSVRVPGERLLERGTPSCSKKFKNFWKSISHDLHRSYDGICAYSCMYVMPPGSVDHFLPKMQFPELAYEWQNYRLSSQRLNQHKGDSVSVIDPFAVREGWFIIDFPSCLVKAGHGVSAAVTTQIDKTIEVLKLNDDDTLVQERCDIMLEYADGNVTIDFLTRRYPFLAQEIIRQGVQDNIKSIFRRRARHEN